jgi:single-strand DNA-binding protein
MNKVILIGNLGKDPEAKDFGDGGMLCRFSIATSRYTKKDGEVADWHQVVCFGKTAELVSRYLTKGSKCAVEGRLQTRKWETPEGETRWSTDVVADRVEFVGGRGSADSGGFDEDTKPGGGFGDSSDLPF